MAVSFPAYLFFQPLSRQNCPPQSFGKAGRGLKLAIVKGIRFLADDLFFLISVGLPANNPKLPYKDKPPLKTTTDSTAQHPACEGEKSVPEFILAYAMVRNITMVMHSHILPIIFCLIPYLFSLPLKADAGVDASKYRAICESKPAVGDLVFTRMGGPIFSRVTQTTQCWTSHVGIIVDYQDGDWVVAESGIPVVRKTSLRKFISRSEHQSFSIRRLKKEPSEQDKRVLQMFADSQLGKPYSLGFDLHSRRTFCSKFVHDALFISTRQSIGEEETFEQLLHRNPRAPLLFWRSWFFGFIPWKRATITPASEFQSPLLTPVIEDCHEEPSL